MERSGTVRAMKSSRKAWQFVQSVTGFGLEGPNFGPDLKAGVRRAETGTETCDKRSSNEDITAKVKEVEKEKEKEKEKGGINYDRFERLVRDIEEEELRESKGAKGDGGDMDEGVSPEDRLKRTREKLEKEDRMKNSEDTSSYIKAMSKFGCAQDRSQERMLFERPTAEKLQMARRFREEGNEKFREEQWSSAASLYQRALIYYEYTFPDTEEERNEFDRDKLAALVNMATVCLKLQKGREALSQCYQALRIEPENPKAALRQAQAHAMLDDYARAETGLRLALETAKKRGLTSLEAAITLAAREVAERKARFLKKEPKVFQQMLKPAEEDMEEKGDEEREDRRGEERVEEEEFPQEIVNEEQSKENIREKFPRGPREQPTKSPQQSLVNADQGSPKDSPQQSAKQSSIDPQALRYSLTFSSDGADNGTPLEWGCRPVHPERTLEGEVEAKVAGDATFNAEAPSDSASESASECDAETKADADADLESTAEPNKYNYYNTGNCHVLRTEQEGQIPLQESNDTRCGADTRCGPGIRGRKIRSSVPHLESELPNSSAQIPNPSAMVFAGFVSGVGMLGCMELLMNAVRGDTTSVRRLALWVPCLWMAAGVTCLAFRPQILGIAKHCQAAVENRQRLSGSQGEKRLEPRSSSRIG